MTREDFLTIYAGIQYWLSLCRIEKATLLQRMLYEVSLDSYLEDHASQKALFSERQTTVQDLEMRLAQTKTSVFLPDIDDSLDEDALVSPTDIEPYIAKGAIGDMSPVTLDDVQLIAADMYILSILLNDPEDMGLAEACFERLPMPAEADVLPRVLACMAYYDYRNGRSSAAEDKFQRSLDMAPENAETYLLRSLVYFSEAKHDLALADIERAEMLKKGDIFIQSLHGDILFERRNIEQSLRLHKSVISRCPMFRRSLLSLGVIYLEMGAPAQAYPYISTILRNEPLNWFALSCLGDIYASQQGQTYRAIPYYTMSVIAGAEEPLIYLNLLKLLVYAGKYKEALSVLHEWYDSRKKKSKATYRFSKMRRPQRYKADLNMIQLICELIVSPGSVEELMHKVHLVEADHVTMYLIHLLLLLVQTRYDDTMMNVCRRSLEGVKALDAYAKQCHDHVTSSGELVLMSAIARMAIWNGFYVEARSFLNLLSQAPEVAVQDAVSLLENEFYAHEAMARSARVDTSLFHVQMINQEADAVLSTIMSDKSGNMRLSPRWRLMAAECLGYRPHDDWNAILVAPEDEAPYQALLKCCTDTMFSHIAKRLRACVKYLEEHLGDTFETCRRELERIIKKDKVFTSSTPATRAMLDYLAYWFKHKTQPRKTEMSLGDYWSAYRLSQHNGLMVSGIGDVACVAAQNDDHVDVHALKAEHFVNIQRPHYFDDTSFRQTMPLWEDSFFELMPSNLEFFVNLITERYLLLYERQNHDGELASSYEQDAQKNREYYTSFYQGLRMLHGLETPQAHHELHQKVEAYQFMFDTLVRLDPRHNLTEFRLSLGSWREKNSPYHLLPNEPFPSVGAYIKLQNPPDVPLVTENLFQPVPGNLITWHDLREMFHNYAVWVIERALEDGDASPLEVFFDREFDFSFSDFSSPHRQLTSVEAMLKAIEACRAQSQRQTGMDRLLIRFGSGTSFQMFLHQYDLWAEKHATELLSTCVRIEHDVYHVTLQRSFETRCRIQSVLNRYPFLSRLYILQAAMFSKLKDASGALKSIRDGLVWEDRLYSGVGWLPIHPDPQDKTKEAPFEICNRDSNDDYPYAIWNDERLDLNQENELSYFYSPWQNHYGMRLRKPYRQPVMIQREMNFDKAGAYDFYRLFSNFIQEIPHVLDVYLRAVATPCLYDLNTYLKFAIRSLESNESFEFHRQLLELYVQIYPLEDEIIPARFCCDNGFSINAMHHAAKALVCCSLEGSPHDAYEASEIIGASLYDLGYIMEAYRFLKVAVSSPNPTPQAYLTLGCACIENRLFDEAVSYLTQGAALDRYNDRFYFNLALAYIELLQYREAEETLRAGLEIARAPYDLGVQLLRVLVKTERIHEAVDLAQMLSKADYDMFVETMHAVEFAQFSTLNPIRALLEDKW